VSTSPKVRIAFAGRAEGSVVKGGRLEVFALGLLTRGDGSERVARMEDTHVAVLLEDLRSQFKVFGEALQSTREEIRRDMVDLEVRLGRRIDGVASDLGKRIDDVSTGLGKRIDDVSTGLGKRIDDVSTGLGKRIDDVSTGLGKRIDGVSTGLGGRIDGVAADVSVLKADVAEVKERLGRVEERLNGAPPPRPRRRKL
jgi:hypothetical protein